MQTKFIKTLRYTFFFLITIVTLLALLVAEENFRGKVLWDRHRSALEARGEHLDFQYFIPPAVADGENFAMTPLLKGLFDQDESHREAVEESLRLSPAIENAGSAGKAPATPSFGNRAIASKISLSDWRAYLGGQDVLSALKKFDPQLAEIRAAAGRPFSRYPIQYERLLVGDMPQPHVSTLISLGKIFSLRACAELAAGQSDAALADVRTVFRISDSLNAEPSLLSWMNQKALIQIGLQIVWEGLRDRRWSDAQLQMLQGDLEKENFIARFRAALRGDRATMTALLLNCRHNPKLVECLFRDLSEMLGGIRLRWFARFVPSAIIYQNLITLNRFHDSCLSVNNLADLLEPDPQTKPDAAGGARFHPYTIMQMDVSSIIHVALLCQVGLDEAVTACALERYFLANGHYPETLQALVPAYLKSVPTDAVDGGALHYRLTNDGRFLLYSIGANRRDDGGTIALTSNGKMDSSQGDWVW